MTFFQKTLPRIKNGAYVINLDDKNVKEHIAFHNLLTELQLYTLILSELNILHIKCYPKSGIHQFFTMYLEYKMMILLRMDSIVSLSWNKCLQENHEVFNSSVI